MSTTHLKDTIGLLLSASQKTVEQIEAFPEAELPGEYKSIAITECIPGAYQPRKHFTEDSLQELSDSIAKQGVLQPLIVRPHGAQFEIIAGERRWRASKIAGLTHVPAIVRETSDESALAFGLLENIQRENLNVLEEAEAYKRLIEEFHLTHEDVALKLGKARASISNALRLLKLSERAKQALVNGIIQTGHAKTLLSLPPAKMGMALDHIMERKLSVRAAERYTKSLLNTRTTMPAIVTKKASSHLVNDLKNALLSNGIYGNCMQTKGKWIIELNEQEAEKFIAMISDSHTPMAQTRLECDRDE